MAESAEGFVNGVQIIGDVCPLGVVSTGALNDHMPRSKMATGGSDGSNARGYGENVGRADGCYMPVQSSCLQDLAEDGLLLFALSGSRAAFCWFDGLSQHQVVEEDLDQGNEYMNTFK
ncbi:uncharacterized protein LOC144011524 isoform X6 [Festucalex cinctus]